ncbi:MAG: hypothetical protein ACTSR8_07350 [Promethearchaeota archaeon]
MIIENIINIIIFVFIFIICIYSQKTTLNEWKESKNTINLALIILIITYQLMAIMEILLIFYPKFNVVYGAGLNSGRFLALINFSVLTVFIFYIWDLKRFYTLPSIISLYIGLGLFLVDNILPFLTYIISVSFISFSFFIFYGKKNNNGILLSLGFLILFYLIGEMITFNSLFTNTFKLIGVLSLYAGVSGFLNKYFLIDEDTKANIRNVWISHLVTIDKEKKSN